MKKKAQAVVAIWVLAIIALASIGGATYVGYQKGWFSKEQQAVGEVEKQVTVKESQSCSGIASVNLLYNDQDAYKAGTDPSSTLTVFGDDERISVSDDATSTKGSVLKSYTALAGNNAGTPSTTYFSKEEDFTTVCSDLPIQPALYKAGAPTITLLEDDGITKFSTTNLETIAASSTYSMGVTVKSPAEQCSAAGYGAVFACQYDASYVSKIERGGGDIESKDYAIYLEHVTGLGDKNVTENATMDQWKTFEWNGAVQDVNKDNINDAGYLCDGAKIDFTLDYTTTSTATAAQQAVINCTWMGINKDLDADKYTVITGIYDEDNNEIGMAKKTTRTYTKV